MKISLCMIVRDEQDNLERVLNSAGDFFDEIIIVDTGSVDATKSVAKKFTDKIYDFEWIDDFSKARNFSFEKATKDYIMWLDADDVIEKSELEKLKLLKSSCKGDIDVYMLKYNIAFDNKNMPVFSYYRERIVKNDKTFVWVDPVHEVITPHGKISYENISISHKKTKPAASGRNLRIYQKLLEKKTVLSPRQKFYYSRELMYNNFIDEAISSFVEFLDSDNGWTENKIEACKNIAGCLLKKNKQKQALEYLIKSFIYSTPRAEILCMIGGIFYDQQKYNDAIFWYELATKIKIDYESGAFVMADYYNIVPYLQLCLCYYKIGNLEKSVYYNNKAHRVNPSHPSVKLNKTFFKNLNKSTKNI